MANKRSGNGVQKRSPSAITGIEVEGFKSLGRPTALEIRPLTIFAGANSSGKSAAIQPLLLLKQTIEDSADRGPLRLDGPCVRFTDADQFFSRGRGSKFSLKIGFGSQSIQLTFSRKGKTDLTVQQETVGFDNRRVSLREGMNSDSIGSQLAYAGRNPTMTVRRAGCFLELKYRLTNAEAPVPVPSNSVSEMVGKTRWSLPRLIHVPSIWARPDRSYPSAAAGTGEFPGIFHDYVASILLNWQGTNDGRSAQLGAYMEYLGLTSQVIARQVADTRIEVSVGRMGRVKQNGSSDLVDIADVGVGVSRALPTLAALLTAQRGQVVYLEEPEAHLHPRAQVALAKIIAESAARGAIVIAETHSPLLLTGVQTLVAEGQLNASLVQLHWFERDSRGFTNVRSQELDNHGAFGEWPADFDDVMLDTESRYLDAASAAHKR